MNETTTFDRLRAWAEGELSASERSRFESEMVADPALARRAREFRAVWRATEGDFGHALSSHTSFDDLMRRSRKTSIERGWRRAAAALLIVAPIAAGAAGAALAWKAWTKRVDRVDVDRVVLHAIPLVAPVSRDADTPGVPDLLARWSPVEGHSIHWLSSMDDARAASAALDLPIFVYGYVPGCPLCKELDETTFKDAAVTALVEHCVPVAIDLTKLDPEEMEALYTRRYPLLEFQDARGVILHTFSGTFLDVDVSAELASGLSDPPAMAWSLVRELASALVRARNDEARGDLSSALHTFSNLVRSRTTPAFEHEGRRGVDRLTEAARVALEEARRQGDAHDALHGVDALQQTALRFRDTPFEPDLRAVIDAWRTTGRFPTLVAESSSAR